MNFKNKNILVCGSGKSGIAAVSLLHKHGAKVVLQDLNPNPNIAIDHLPEGIITYFGKNPDDILHNFDMIVISPGISIYLPFVEKAKSLSVPVIGEIELGYYFCDTQIIAITGTNGKTTTTSLVEHIVKLHMPNSVSCGNIGTPFCQVVQDIKDGIIIAEISSFQLETIVNFRPKISCVLNMTEDHLNRHKTMDIYVSAKERIFENQLEDDICVLNYDNKYTKDMIQKTKIKPLLFSMYALPDRYEGVYVKDNAIYMQMKNYNGKLLDINDMFIFGRHNIENAMAAAAMAAAANIPRELIVKGLRDFRAVSHRLEFVREKNGVKYYNDSKATNIDSSLKALEAVRQLKKPIILIGGGQNKGMDYTAWVQAFKNNVKHFICIGEVAGEVLELCKAHNFLYTDKANSLKDAVDIAFAKAIPGDAVLLSPASASFDMFDNYEERGHAFKNFVNNL